MSGGDGRHPVAGAVPEKAREGLDREEEDEMEGKLCTGFDVSWCGQHKHERKKGTNGRAKGMICQWLQWRLRRCDRGGVCIIAKVKVDASRSGLENKLKFGLHKHPITQSLSPLPSDTCFCNDICSN